VSENWLIVSPPVSHRFCVSVAKVPVAHQASALAGIINYMVPGLLTSVHYVVC